MEPRVKRTQRDYTLAFKLRVFEAVIDVLRKDYGVRVVKKPLGKSSTKRSSKD